MNGGIILKKYMDRLETWLNKYLLPAANVINENHVMTAIKDGMMFTMPVILFSSIILILTNFPFMNQFAPSLYAWLNTSLGFVYDGTMGLLALFVIIGTANSYSKLKKIDPLYGVLVAFAAFMIVTPTNTVTDVVAKGKTITNATVSGVIPMEHLGASGIFAALIVSILAVRFYAVLFHKDLTIKMPDTVPANVTKPFLSVIPFGCTVLVFVVVRNLMALTPYASLPDAINQLLTKPLLGFGNSIWAFLVLLFIAQLLWFFGIHGTNITLNAVWLPIATVAMATNLDAFNAGKPLPYVLTAAFTCYTGQAKLSEIVALLVLGKSKRSKALSKSFIVPALFNIHEPFVFGLPVVLNTTLFIPWMLVEILQAGLAYGLMLLTNAIPIYQAPWTTPPILNQLIATNFNPWSAVIAVATFALGFVLWAPFIQLLDKQFLAEETSQISKEELNENGQTSHN